MGSYADYKKRKAQASQTTGGTVSQEKTAYQKYQERKKAAGGGGAPSADYEAYIADYEKFASAAEADSKTAGYGNALSNLESRIGTAKDLRDRASKLELYLHANSGSMSADEHSSMLAAVETAEKEIDKIMDFFHGETKFYSRWDTEEDYNAYAAEQEAYQQTLDYDVTAGEKKIADLQSQIDSLDWTAHNDRVKMEELSNLIEQEQARVDEAKKTQAYAKQSELAAATPDAKPGTLTQTVAYKEPEQKWYQGWVDTGAFSDGYQFGDVTKTVAASGVDLLKNAGAGLAELPEKLLDGMMTAGNYYAQGQYYQNGGGYNLEADAAFEQGNRAAKEATAEFVKKDLYDGEEVSKQVLANAYGALSTLNPLADAGSTDMEAARANAQAAMDYMNNRMEGDSVFAEKSDALAQSAGQMAGTAALQAVGVPWFFTSGFSAMGSETESALQQGASADEAALSGLIAGAAEVLTEQLGGVKFGGKTLEDSITKKLSQAISNKFVRYAAKTAVGATMEGAEEWITEAASQFGRWLTYQDDQTLYQLMSSEEATNERITAFLSGAAMGGFNNAAEGLSDLKADSNPSQGAQSKSNTQTPPSAETASGTNPVGESGVSGLTELVDGAIAATTGAPADPLAAALESYSTQGKITNDQARDILNNTKSITQLLQQTGIKLPDTASGRRNAVKEAVAQLAERQAAQTVDTAQNSVYDNQNTTGGNVYADAEQPGLSGTYETGLPGGAGAERLRGINPQQVPTSGQTPGGVETGGRVDSGGMEAESGSGGLEVQLRVSPVLRISNNLAAAQQQSGINAYPVRDTTAQPHAYADALAAGRSSDSVNGWCVTPKSAQELQGEGVRTIMNDTGTVGVGIAQNGDIVAVFKNKDGGPPRALDTIMPIAIEQGGDRLDCYGEGLVYVYENYGFVPVARVEFNSEYANDGWTLDKGTPYIYFMMHNGDGADQVASNIRKYPHAAQEQLDALPTFGKDDYDAAMSYRDSLMNPRTQSVQAKNSPTASTEVAVAASAQSFNNAADSAPAESVGAAPGGFDPVSHLQYEHGTIPEGENPVRPDDLPKRDANGDKVSYTARTVKGAKVTPDEFVDLLNKEVTGGALSYMPITNSATVRSAMETIQRKGWDQTLEDWRHDVRNGKGGAERAAIGALLLNNAAKAGDVATWRDILLDYRLMGTNMAQGMQALRILKTLSPSDKLYGIKRSVEQMVEDLHLNVEVTIDEGLVQEYEDAETEAQRDQILGEIQQNVADQLPGTWAERWNALRYLNMLGNFRTQIRNIVGNVSMKLLNSTKNAVATGLEAAISKISGGKLQRTKSFTVSKELLAAAKSDFENVKSIVSDGGKYSDAPGKSTDFARGVQEKRQIFKFKPAEGYRKLTNWAMEAGDIIFSKSAYARALAGYLKANGVTGGDLSQVDTNLMEDARLYAIKEAQEVTFRDSNWLSDWISKVGRRKDTPLLGRIVSEGTVPFRKTPANVLIRAEEYSPLGILNSLTMSAQKIASETKLADAKGAVGSFARSGEQIDGAQVINSWAKSLTGTGLFALGMLLSSLGCLSAGAGEDESEDDFQSMYGWQNYAINLPGGLNFTIDCFTPSAIPMLMGAELMQLIDEDGFELKDLEAALTSIAEPMVQMSMLQGVNDTLENIRYSENSLGQLFINASLSYLTQGLTNSLVGQLERTFEDTRMTTYVDPNSSLPSWLQRTLSKASAKTPIWDYNQIPYLNAWGEEEENPEWYINGAYNLLSPSYIETGISTEVSEELIRLNKAQSDSVFPTDHPKSITVDGVRIDFTAEQYVNYAKSRGSTAKEVLEGMVSSDLYQSLPDEYRAKAIQFAYTYAAENAQIDLFGREVFGSDWMAELDGDIADGILCHVLKENIKSMYLDGSISQEEAIQRRITYCGDSEEDAIAKVDYWNWRTANPQYADWSQSTVEKYESVPVDTTAYVLDLLDGLQSAPRETKADGSSYTNVRDIQKMEAVVSDDKLTAYVDDLLHTIMSDSMDAKYDTAIEQGYTPEQFVEGYRQYLDTTGEGKKQEFIRYCREEMGMTAAVAKKLYEIYSPKK